MSCPPQSDPLFVRKHRINEITIHVTPTRVKAAPPSPTSRMRPIHGDYQLTKFEPNPSSGLGCTLRYNFFARVCAIARGSCHVQPIGLKLLPSSFRRFGASNEHSPVPIRQTVRAPEAKMLGQTDRRTDGHTYTQTPARLLFSSDPPEEVSEQKPSMLKH